MSGIVFGDGQPLANTQVELRTSNGRSAPWTVAPTDASGRYRTEFPNISSLAVWVSAHDRGFPWQPCAAGFEQAEPGPPARTVDVRLSSSEGLSSAPLARIAGRRTISGTVYTLTPSGKQPASEVTVLWDLSSDDFEASTRTDAAGRFSFCAMPVTSRVVLFALTGGYETYQQGWASIEPGGDDLGVEIILRRPED